MADPDFEQAKAELAQALDARLTVQSRVDPRWRGSFTDLLAYVDEHVALDIPNLLQVTSRVDNGTRSLNDALGFIDEHVTVDIPAQLAALQKSVDALTAAVAA